MLFSHNPIKALFFYREVQYRPFSHYQLRQILYGHDLTELTLDGQREQYATIEVFIQKHDPEDIVIRLAKHSTLEIFRHGHRLRDYGGGLQAQWSQLYTVLQSFPSEHGSIPALFVCVCSLHGDWTWLDRRELNSRWNDLYTVTTSSSCDNIFMLLRLIPAFESVRILVVYDVALSSGDLGLSGHSRGWRSDL
jgi:hypothetical protein